MAFSAAKWSLSAREEYIGWSEESRIENLRSVVANDRFLIVPTVRVENLASHVLAMALRRLPEDWYERYQIRPVLVETFVNPTRFSGICYKASNWVEVGYTAGRRDGVQKKIFVYTLCKEWRDVLCEKPEVKLGEKPRVENPARWAEQEFGTLRLYDTRLKERLYTKETEPPETPPTIRQAIWMVGIIGGHLGRKRDGMPGTECI
ncbi:MAG: Transposase protein [Candidatus Brocadiaceae bacterium]|nr:Transposase protein [Candidatus Brocadiaceae bacterium]